MLIASSVWAGLKRQGYHVTVFASPPGSDVITEDPNIDKLVLFDKDQVPNGDLGSFWKWQAKNYDKFVNLSESMEGTFLALPGRIQHGWPPALRHKMMDFNYLEFAHGVAGVPHDPDIRFYTTDEERKWAAKERSKLGDGPLIMWSLAGSSVHKTWAGLDNILASIMLSYPKAHVVLVGGPECAILEAGWETEPRVHLTCGKWKMRQTLAMLEHVDLVIGPETGVLNAASCMEDVAKVVILSHSTHENLTRDWPNTTAVWSHHTVCPGRGNNEAPACHSMQYGFEYCKQEQTSGVAQCQADISLEQVWGAVEKAMQQFAEELEAA
jgi:ADP-heptose:LPS heptosyltransferase